MAMTADGHVETGWDDFYYSFVPHMMVAINTEGNAWVTRKAAYKP